MGGLEVDHTPIPPLRAVFEGARRFGLTEQETWCDVDASLSVVGSDATISEYLDELAGALARRILSKQRGEPSTTI